MHAHEALAFLHFFVVKVFFLILVNFLPLCRNCARKRSFHKIAIQKMGKNDWGALFSPEDAISREQMGAI